MPNHELNLEANILDLTSKQTLFELAVDESELLGHAGAKLIADMRDRAREAEYTHLYFRDPVRPGIVWFLKLEEGTEEYSYTLPVRGKLDECRLTTEKVFPGFLSEVESRLQADVDEQESKSNMESSEENVIMAQIPPIAQGVSGVDLATALEYLIFVYPSMVRAWVALIFTYSEILKLKEGAETVQKECLTQCQHPEIVAYLTPHFTEENPEQF